MTLATSNRRLATRCITATIGVVLALLLASSAEAFASAEHRDPARPSGTAAFAGFSAGAVARGTGYATHDGSDRVRTVQRRLLVRGFDPGPADGRFGPRTERATRRFQEASQLTVDGIVGRRTLVALKAPRARHGASRSTGAPRGQAVLPAPAISPDLSNPGQAVEARPHGHRALWLWLLVAGGLVALALAIVRRGRPLRPRALPLNSRGKSVAAGLLSVVALLLLALYLLAPPVHSSGCTGACEPARWAQLLYNIAACSVLTITLYFLGVCLVGLFVMRRAPRGPVKRQPFFVLVVPARNEELVIGVAVRRMLELRGAPLLALIMNDGSEDQTSAVARRAAAGDPRLIVVDRPPEIAGVGKGEVLNHAYRVIRELVWDQDPRLNGASADDVVLCVVDADGWLQANALEAVAPYYDDPDVAGVQIPVRMYNARAGFLAFMQDMEFIGYSLLVQGGRDRVGSVALGGNGQFIRLSALAKLGAAPWTRSLVEDLDIGLTLVKRGWRNRMCPHTHVAQQAVTKPRRLLRQRTRWIQGHYTCWSHLPSLWRARSVPRITRMDLSLHLFLAITVLLGAIQTVLGLVGYLGLYPIQPSVIAGWLDADILYRASIVVMACGPLALLSVAYQRAAVRFQGSADLQLPVWSLPGMLLVYTAYTYFWGLPCSLRAFARIALRRRGWTKTARDPLTTAPAAAGTPIPRADSAAAIADTTPEVAITMQSTSAGDGR